MKHYCRILWVLMIIGIGCDDGEHYIAKGDDTDYFPLKVGFFQIYDIEEIRYQQGFDPDTLRYQLKMDVVDSFANAGGSTTYVLYRSVRNHSTDTWQFSETWSVRRDFNQIVVSEGNTAYVKLLLPASEGLTWDGNRYNNLGLDRYEIISYDKNLSLAALTFEKTLTVQQEFNDDPIVYTDIRKEVYAREAGLVFKETIQLVICQAQTCNSNEIIERGIKWTQTIKEYGNG